MECWNVFWRLAKWEFDLKKDIQRVVGEKVDIFKSGAGRFFLPAFGFWAPNSMVYKTMDEKKSMNYLFILVCID